MFYVGVILLGFVSFSKLSWNLLPDLSYPKISVVTEYPGAGAEEIERFITNVLEGPLSSISNMKKIDSISKEGISIISLEFHWGTDMDFALLHTKEQVEGVRQNLPDDCDAPVIMEWDPSASPIMTVILKSDVRNLKKQKEAAEYIFKPRLEQLRGISRVEIRGGDEEEISVEINPEKIKDLGISISDIATTIENDNIFQSGGTVKKDKLRYILKIEGELKTPAEIEEIVVGEAGGRRVQIRDIGRAFFKNKVRQGNIRFNSKSSIALLLYREAGGNTVEATRAAIEALDTLKKDSNNEIEFQVVAMEAELIISSINSLESSLLLGAILAIFILLLFLQNYKDPFLVSVVMPICVIATFVLMFAFDVSINIMSLGGLVLGVGMFVDNSIIVLEAIARHRDKKEQLVPAVIDGAKEVSGAISASTLTTISIFLPVIYLYGVTGKLFKEQALTVSFSLVSSLIVAITLLPALSVLKAAFKSDNLSDILKPKDIVKKNWYQSAMAGIYFIISIPFKLIGYVLYFFIAGIIVLIVGLFKNIRKVVDFLLEPTYKYFNKFYTKFDNFYHKILEKILNKKSIALLLSIIILSMIGLGLVLLKKELLPTPKTRKFEINASTIPSYGFEQTDIIASNIEKELLKIPGVTFVFTESGSVSTFAATSEDISVNSIHFIVECQSPHIRSQIMEQSRGILKKADLLEYNTSLEQNTLSQYLGTSGENFQLKVFYQDIDEGKKAVDAILPKIDKIKGLYDFKTTTTEGKPLFVIKYKQSVLDKFNIRRSTIANYINQAVRGENAGLLKQMQKNYDIMVRVPVEGIIAIQKMMSLPININNTTFYLKDLVEVEEQSSIKKITRESQERYFLISANARHVPLNEVIKAAEEKLLNVEMPVNTRYMFSGEEEERRKAFDSLNQAIWLAILLVYMIMAAKFENLLQPLIIMLTVPMGLIGAFWILLATGNSLSIISGIGILVLIGIGVNDAIVKVEYSNQLRKSGLGVREAVLQASKVRLRPILMTSLTTIFGVLPMAIMNQAGSELQRSLALVIIGGLICTTLLTLILIPVCYELLEKLTEKRKAKKKK